MITWLTRLAAAAIATFAPQFRPAACRNRE
jgi:hypothetical protein